MCSGRKALAQRDLAHAPAIAGDGAQGPVAEAGLGLRNRRVGEATYQALIAPEEMTVVNELSDICPRVPVAPSSTLAANSGSLLGGLLRAHLITFDAVQTGDNQRAAQEV